MADRLSQDFTPARGILLKNIGLYLASVFLVTFYGIQVCPFLEQLTVVELASEIGVAFALVFMVKSQAYRRGSRLDDKIPALQKPWVALRSELAVGLVLSVWNGFWYQFPLESGLKLVMGALTIGIFSSTYLALDVEHVTIHCYAERSNVDRIEHGRFFSITTKFLMFVSASLIVFAVVIMLLIYKDFLTMIESYETMMAFEFRWVVQEVLYVFAILLVGSFVAAKHYCRNLELMFDLQLKALSAVESGNYDSFVPVVSRDEFSQIASHTNEMIVGLRDRERIKRSFGKYLSPTIAESILSSEEETNLGGREVEVAVLFTDLRGFTPYSEKCSPQDLLGILNEYFTMVVAQVHGHEGVLDKFIGDAAMAVFGLEADSGNACDNALETSLAIRTGLEELNKKLEGRGLEPLQNGVGIHYGNVVAGNIGSEERLEYTVIGDTVNTASRLESATKDLPTSIAISVEAYEQLSDANRERMTEIGEVALKGKSHPLTVFGQLAAA